MSENGFYFSIVSNHLVLHGFGEPFLDKYLLKRKKGRIFNSFEDANSHFKKIVNNNDLLMVKGSNATGLNKFTKNIKKGKN